MSGRVSSPDGGKTGGELEARAVKKQGEVKNVCVSIDLSMRK